MHLWIQDIRKKSQINGKRYEFQTNHGFRKWFKTRCEIAGMKSINIEILMGHSIGISDSYYRITEDELQKDYLKAVNFLTINPDKTLIQKIEEQNKKSFRNTGDTKTKRYRSKSIKTTRNY